MQHLVDNCEEGTSPKPYACFLTEYFPKCGIFFATVQAGESVVQIRSYLEKDLPTLVEILQPPQVPGF
jgi:hypothetical protein